MSIRMENVTKHFFAHFAMYLDTNGLPRHAPKP